MQVIMRNKNREETVAGRWNDVDRILVNRQIGALESNYWNSSSSTTFQRADVFKRIKFAVGEYKSQQRRLCKP